MMLTDLWVDQRRLYIFCWVADLGSMKAAADTLQLSPSTVSQSVSQLEREVGLALVQSVGRSITITPTGRDFAARAKSVLETSMTFRSWVHNVAEQEDGHISISYLESVVATWIPAAVAALLHRWPDLNIDLVRGDGAGDEPETDRPTINLVVTDIEARKRTRPDMASRTLVTEPYFAISRSPSRALRSPVELKSLDARAVITTDSQGTLCHQLLARAFERAGFTDVGWVHVPDTTTAVELAVAGLGVAVLPRSAAAGLTSRGNLSTRKIAEVDLERTVAAQYLVRDAATEPVITALEALESAAAHSRPTETPRRSILPTASPDRRARR